MRMQTVTSNYKMQVHVIVHS